MATMALSRPTLTLEAFLKPRFCRQATIEVLPVDILNGVRRNPWIDPVGHAVKRAIPFSRQVRVSTVDIAFTINHPWGHTERYVVDTPPEVAAWIERFDAGKQVRPMSFPISWLEEQ